MDAAHNDVWGGTGPAYLIGLGGVVPVQLSPSDCEAPGVVYVVDQSGQQERFNGGGEDRLSPPQRQNNLTQSAALTTTSQPARQATHETAPEIPD
jgi:hypothetical protein